MNKYVESNRSLWDGWTRLHAHSEFYDLAGFKAGRSSLKAIELAEMGDVRGKSLLHLQCHFGQDTLSWARLGAEVTGVDFSDEAEGFSHPEYNWEHSLSDVINAVIRAGLRLEFVHEFPYTWHIPAYPSLEEFAPGKGRLKGHFGLLPHMFSLRAVREPERDDKP